MIENTAENAEKLLAVLGAHVPTRNSRIRKAGPWCFFCGATQPLGICGCAFPGSLGCDGQRLCSACRSAHHLLADHLRKMFAARIVDRVSSVRLKLFHQIIGAAESLAEVNHCDPEKEGGLKFRLSQADAIDDSQIQFRGTVLAAFSKSRFSDFVGLARELSREKTDDIINRLARQFVPTWY